MHKYTDRPLWRWIIWEGSNAKPRLITARRPAVISSPILGVFAVTAAGPGLRRGHVIYSGVFAVAAVTAAGVPCLVHSLACPGEFR
jgi:hypothetical protein